MRFAFDEHIDPVFIDDRIRFVEAMLKYNFIDLQLVRHYHRTFFLPHDRETLLILQHSFVRHHAYDKIIATVPRRLQEPKMTFVKYVATYRTEADYHLSIPFSFSAVIVPYVDLCIFGYVNASAMIRSLSFRLNRFGSFVNTYFNALPCGTP